MTPQHRLQCTPAQYASYRKIIEFMKADKDDDMRDRGREFVTDDKNRTLTASRFAWNCFRHASDLYAVHVEKEMITAIQRDRDVLAMLGDKSSVVAVEVKPKAGMLF